MNVNDLALQGSEPTEHGRPLNVFCNVCQREVDRYSINVETPVVTVPVFMKRDFKNVHTGEVIIELCVECHGEEWREKHSNWYGRIA